MMSTKKKAFIGKSKILINLKITNIASGILVVNQVFLVKFGMHLSQICNQGCFYIFKFHIFKRIKKLNEGQFSLSSKKRLLHSTLMNI